MPKKQPDMLEAAKRREAVHRLVLDLQIALGVRDEAQTAQDPSRQVFARRTSGCFARRPWSFPRAPNVCGFTISGFVPVTNGIRTASGSETPIDGSKRFRGS